MAEHNHKKPIILGSKHKGPPKQYQQDGVWVVKPRKTAILVCACGNRYIKTRPGQSVCLRCMFGHNQKPAQKKR